jgi:transcriptional regulator with XRE-family HTH domain
MHRKAAGLRQLDVAKFLGFESTDRISRWEKGTAVPHLANALKLSLLYKAPVHELYGDYFKMISASVAGTP